MDTLEQLMNGNPGAFFERQQQWNSEQQRREADLASVMQQTQQRQQLLPLDIKQRQANIDADTARLPGIQADSSIRARQNKKEDLLFDDEMRGHIGKLKADEAKRYMEQLSNAANAYSVGGQYLADAPGGATHDMARKVLGPYYRPEFDQISPGALGQAISYFGKNMAEVAPKFQQEMDMLKLKQEFALTKQQRDLEAKQQMAQYAANVKQAVAQLMATKNPTTMWGAYNKLQEEMYAASARGETDKVAILNERINELVATAGGLEKLKADARKAGTIDAAAVAGLPENPPPTVPRVPVPGQGNNPAATPSSGSPAQNRKSSVPGVKPGYVALFKDGKVVGQVPFEQAEAAKAEGYEVK